MVYYDLNKQILLSVYCQIFHNLNVQPSEIEEKGRKCERRDDENEE